MYMYICFYATNKVKLISPQKFKLQISAVQRKGRGGGGGEYIILCDDIKCLIK